MSEYQLTIADDDSWSLTLSDQGVSIADAHASTHAAAGSDPITISTSQVTGLSSMATQASSAVSITGGTIAGVTVSSTTLSSPTITTPTITGGTITGITDLSLADGGTGASSAPAARTNLGIGSLGTQNANGVAITGGTITGVAITGITDLAVADGGTGASTLTGILIGNGTSAFTAATSSTVGQVIRCTGANTYAFGAVDLDDTDAVTGTLAIANGGTNATTAAAALSNLGIGFGHGTLAAGTLTVTDARATTTSIIVATHHTSTGPTGHLYVDNSTNGTFDINSTAGGDTNDVDYIIIY